MLSAVPERIRHAFLHVRDYAKMHRGSLQIDFMQTIKPRSVPLVLFLPHHTAPISSSHFFVGKCNIISDSFMLEVGSKPST